LQIDRDVSGLGDGVADREGDGAMARILLHRLVEMLLQDADLGFPSSHTLGANFSGGFRGRPAWWPGLFPLPLGRPLPLGSVAISVVMDIARLRSNGYQLRRFAPNGQAAVRVRSHNTHEGRSTQRGGPSVF
jgi:hypothetical protein